MEARFVQDGASIDYTPTADTPAGTVVVQNDLVGITKLDIPADQLGALSVSGVFAVAKATGGGEAIAAGIKVYWDDTAKVATATAAGNTYLGKVASGASDDDLTVLVRLQQ